MISSEEDRLYACCRLERRVRVIDSVYLDWAIGLAVVFFLGGALVSGLNEGRLGVLRLWGTSLARRVPGIRKIGWIAELDTRDKRPLIPDRVTADKRAERPSPEDKAWR